jgi:hypothetical protein
VLAVYHYDRKAGKLLWSEQHLYGSSRLGMYQPEKIVASVSTDSKQREEGDLRLVACEGLKDKINDKSKK